MDIIWDEEKNNWLKLERGISFEYIADRVLENDYLDIVENPSRDNQLNFVMAINDYTWVVPFIIDEQDRIIFKTAFPSRKFHKRYGGKHEDR